MRSESRLSRACRCRHVGSCRATECRRRTCGIVRRGDPAGRQRPQCMSSRDFQRVSDLVARQRLRSSSTSTLVVPLTRRSTAGDRAFPVAAARTWNSLPASLTPLSSLASFRRQLKTELFVRSFPESTALSTTASVSYSIRSFASQSRFVTVFNVCTVSLQSFDITHLNLFF